MHLRLISILALLTLALAACGGQPNPTASLSPEQTVNQAYEALTNKDEASLTDMFDSSVSGYASLLAQAAIMDWRDRQAKANLDTERTYGPIQSHQIGATETSGQTTRVIMTVTYEVRTADWLFSLRQRDQGWKLLEIRQLPSIRKQP